MRVLHKLRDAWVLRLIFMRAFIQTVLRWFFSEPVRIVKTGSVLLRTGAILLFFGSAAMPVGLALNLASQATRPVSATLSQLFPAWPTWWIPESVGGYIFAMLLLGVGVYIKLLGVQFQKLTGEQIIRYSHLFNSESNLLINAPEMVDSFGLWLQMKVVVKAILELISRQTLHQLGCNDAPYFA